MSKYPVKGKMKTNKYLGYVLVKTLKKTNIVSIIITRCQLAGAEIDQHQTGPS